MHCQCLNILIYVYRNPWGKGKKGNWEGPWSDGSKEFTPEAQAELGHKFGNDSVFWISFEDLLRKYQHFDRTRLFMDSPDWRVTQQWISVEVPWRAEFEQRFRIVLKKESPVVLVLSQLDDRYFDGLQGQYRFRLQFRLHEVGSSDEEDYIVRSHGNYLMDRSVVTELKSLNAGTYSVYVMVVADRDTNMDSVEEVVRAQCRDRIDNDKLSRVGMAYDLAHKKGAYHLESKAAIREAREKAKAREARIATRRKNWEKSHLSRSIYRKQTKKNKEKREQKMAGRGAEARETGVREHYDHYDMRLPPKAVNEGRFRREDRAVQTEESFTTAPTEMEPLEPQAANGNDKGVQTEDMAASFAESQGTLDTPESGLTSPRSRRVPIEAQGAPNPPGAVPPYDHEARRESFSRRRRSRDHRHHHFMTSEGDSSASPISDIEDLHSEDDEEQRHPRRMNSGEHMRGNHRRSRDSEDESDPWNAVCIVGLRVYSKDEGLEVMVFEEGFDDVVKVEEAKDDAGTDGDVEDLGDDKGDVGEKLDINAAVDKKECDITTETKDTPGEETPLLDGTSTPEQDMVEEGGKNAAELSKEESVLSTDADGGAALLEKIHL